MYALRPASVPLCRSSSACLSAFAEKAAQTLIGMAGPLKNRLPRQLTRPHNRLRGAWPVPRCRWAVHPIAAGTIPPTAEINHTRTATRKRRLSGCSPTALWAVGPLLGADSPRSVLYVAPALWCGGRDSADKPRRLSVGPQSRGNQGGYNTPTRGGVVDPPIVASVPSATIRPYGRGYEGIRRRHVVCRRLRRILPAL